MIKSIISKFKAWTRGSAARKEASQPKTGDEPPASENQKAPGPSPGDGTSQETRTGRARPPRKRSRRPRRPRGEQEKKGKAQVQDPSAAPVPSAPREEEAWDISRFKVPELEGRTRFHDLQLPDEIMRAVFDLGFQYCTPIQAAMLPHVLAGSDAAGKAQTGTGKTAVYMIGALRHLLNNPPPRPHGAGRPRVLILGPTRELVIQIEKDARDLARHTPHRTVAVYGGMDYEKQRRQLTDSPVDIVAATPGRLLDFQRQGDIRLDRVEMLVIDEADRMLDMGFIPDVQQIVRSTPYKDKRQTLLLSATLSEDVTRLASQWTRDPVTVDIEPEQVAVDSVKLIIYIVTMEDKFALLYNLITLQNLKKVIVFGNRRDQTRRLTEQLNRYGIKSELLSGEVDQKKRVRVLESFKGGKTRVLVATDVAARGLHIDDVSHVINYHLPMDPEDYVHRIGRTGRAGATGISISFASEDDSFQIPVIEKYIGRGLKCIHPEDDWLVLPPPPPAPSSEQKRAAPSRRPGGGSRGGAGSAPSRKRPGNRKKSAPNVTGESSS